MKLKRLGLDDFRKRRGEGFVSEIVLPKAFATEIAEVKSDDLDTSRVLSFTISNGDIDRDNDTIDPKGWELANFRKGGAMLWAHDPTKPPVGKPLKTFEEGGQLKSIVEFPSAETHEFGNLVFRLFREGFMRATSVGFRPLEFEVNEERRNANGFPGIDFKRQELLEFSAVPVPSNPGALVEASHKGIDIAPLIDWTRKQLDDDDKGAAIFVPREHVEKLHAELTAGVPEIKTEPTDDDKDTGPSPFEVLTEATKLASESLELIERAREVLALAKATTAKQSEELEDPEDDDEEELDELEIDGFDTEDELFEALSKTIHEKLITPLTGRLA